MEGLGEQSSSVDKNLQHLSFVVKEVCICHKLSSERSQKINFFKNHKKLSESNILWNDDVWYKEMLYGGRVVMRDNSCREVVGSNTVAVYWMVMTFFHIDLLKKRYFLFEKTKNKRKEAGFKKKK